ncbi:MAG: OmpA family protein [Geminicoccaceae bacterium]
MKRSYTSLVAAGLLLASGAAMAQQGPTYSAEELARILSNGSTPAEAGNPVFSADELARILQPQPQIRTRGLKAGSGIEPGTTGSGVVPDLRVNFEVNSFALTADSKATLNELAKAMQMDQLSSLRFEIGGHTDASGSAGYNQQLSEKRAASVVDYLLGKGVERQRLDWIGHGEEMLADPNNPRSGVNRRVEVRTKG